MRARCQPVRDRLNPFAVFLLTTRSPWPVPLATGGIDPARVIAVPIIRTGGDAAVLRAVEHRACCGWCQPKPRRGAL